MQFTLTKVLAFALAVATGVSAGAVADSQAIKQQTEGKCDIGNVSCCNPTNVDKTDGLLNNLLEWGVVGSLVNGQGSACAPVSLIDELGILALVKDTPDGPVCENVIACCPGQGAQCVAIGDGSGSGSGYSD
ncbi:hypothetical protein BO83DRAFT_428985 [Aspergillus eucalypticola CBS 122712]|uniref:Hydrophobin n=1 Tax=Aspergillus eucalypticola (strain CBS 122712 / IBT 29274) TaxID=1448314 RepID=A0A317V4I5_ASPEC|nr:uncharacterized protein BO83DRAFT_428985 [Aspergillus eucalypticola CBS 122712]PWY68876.1 hypothetical protein BO83DRAFT_428985 [Aspergillus eucalypticola CBS 122712]